MLAKSFPVFFVLLLLGGCKEPKPQNVPDPETYRKAVSAFYSGVTAMQIGEDRHADARLTEVTRLVPDEPAAWANLGLLALRRGAFDVAEEHLDQARRLAPENTTILLFSGLLESNRGQSEAAIGYLRQAVTLDSSHVYALYALVQELERQQPENPEALALLAKILTLRPDNLAAFLETARLASRQGDHGRRDAAVAALSSRASAWPAEIQTQQVAVSQAAASGNLQEVSTQLAFLRNMLLSLPDFRQDLGALQVPPEQVGEPMARLLLLPTPKPTSAPPDLALSFTETPLQGAAEGSWSWVAHIALEGTAFTPVVANGQQVQVGSDLVLPFPGGKANTAPASAGLAFVDLNYDFRMDLALAGAGGLHLYQQDSTNHTFIRIPNLPQGANRPFSGVWAADLDQEGDLDLVAGSVEGPPLVLRNNGDGTFIALPLFDNVEGLQGFAWADLDGDTTPDAVLLDSQGRLHLFLNERQVRFRPVAPPITAQPIRALHASDSDSDGQMDLVAFLADGILLRLGYASDHTGWESHVLAQWTSPPAANLHLFTADLDDNGGLDLVASGDFGSRIWLQDEAHNFQPREHAFENRLTEAIPFAEDGPLDLVGLSKEGSAQRISIQRTLPYRGKNLRLRAATALGDQRINTFGIGGEVEIRAGLLFQKQAIQSPTLHFGLGENEAIDLARIVWPNGDVQAEFDLGLDDVVDARQRLKGSCPWLFTFDGEKMAFVTDFIWRSPLGLRINAQETAGIMATEDWVKIRGNQLVAREGFYDVRITAELWETHFFDHVSLLVVDHPVGTDIFVDERFAFPPPPTAIHTTAPPTPVAQAWDDQGKDVTEWIATRDARYLDTFGRGAYQGITRDHFVEIDPGEAMPSEGPVWLLATGWIRPTDSSINVAISHGRQDPPQGLRLEVPDGDGGWKGVYPNLGFPSGKEKTILIDLENIFVPGAPRRLRLGTNLEIYWDALHWASALPETPTQVQRLNPSTATLRYRGFSEYHEKDRSSPELPTYANLAGTAPRWLNLEGYHTRFGDVRELLHEVDDRYVIMNAGDEMAFLFPAPDPPAEGWVRDFVLIGDGWVKDGDFNTAFSRTVLPLPTHARPDYDTPPRTLQDDPVYQLHASDWQTYHTRYVTPERFQRALRIR